MCRLIFLLGSLVGLFATSTSAQTQDSCDFQIDVGEDFNFFPDAEYQLEVFYSVPPDAIGGISWMPPDYLSCTHCADPIATPEEPICYTVTVTDTSGCTLSDTLCIGITAIQFLKEPGLQVEVFPNPAYDFICLQTDGAVFQEVRIVNSQGTVVQTQKSPSTTRLEMVLSSLADGIYFLVVETARGLVVKPIVIDRG
jgi:hypothetical protein